MSTSSQRMHRIADRMDINDCLCRYARGVDRGDLALVRAAYHPDAYDDHVEYKGDVDGLIAWLQARFANVDNSVHFLGNSLVEFAGEDSAFVETYFASRRLRPATPSESPKLAPDDRICRQSWGRYLDHFERREGEWRVARRVVVMEAVFATVALGGARHDASTSWASRGRGDPLYEFRHEVFALAGTTL